MSVYPIGWSDLHSIRIRKGEEVDEEKVVGISWNLFFFLYRAYLMYHDLSH